MIFSTPTIRSERHYGSGTSSSPVGCPANGQRTGFPEGMPSGSAFTTIPRRGTRTSPLHIFPADRGRSALPSRPGRQLFFLRQLFGARTIMDRGRPRPRSDVRRMDNERGSPKACRPVPHSRPSPNGGRGRPPSIFSRRTEAGPPYHPVRESNHFFYANFLKMMNMRWIFPKMGAQVAAESALCRSGWEVGRRGDYEPD